MDRWEVPESEIAERAARVDDSELDQGQRGDEPETSDETGSEQARELKFEVDSADAYEQTIDVPDGDGDYRDQ